MINDQPVSIVLDGATVPLGLQSDDPLPRAVLISLFTWRRANPDDDLPGDLRMGWWGDSYAPVEGDRIGSRLWLLCRAKLTQETVSRAREYAEEALAWLVADGIAARVVVEAERQGLTTLALACRIYQGDGRLAADIRFTDVWGFLNGI